ncbi:hypothetical protein BKP35_06575 [Anaerobacillus arseniciselenatis]|uniref:Uncharacterized protein n=1 Tax=Anaerobacillus arseniciselenatis TaxID=85682 RepID=A0A1S2LSA0_9BACI|nr:hypothetical protein [Anaerobacillus arseniciselenatis]OIJ14537.1 hypothetical protein BKP35_06575 [Anaerobacillus arseniciselenatis]
MPRKVVQVGKRADKETEGLQSTTKDSKEEEITKLNRLLGAVLRYLSDDDVEEIDIEYLLKNTEGLREWWDQYRENNRKEIEEEIKKSLSELSLKELESIREKVKAREG